MKPVDLTVCRLRTTLISLTLHQETSRDSLCVKSSTTRNNSWPKAKRTRRRRTDPKVVEGRRTYPKVVEGRRTYPKVVEVVHEPVFVLENPDEGATHALVPVAHVGLETGLQHMV